MEETAARTAWETPRLEVERLEVSASDIGDFNDGGFPSIQTPES